jgi:prepilin-type N-terminal cleavage/methylation domain-containing protein
MSAVLAKVQTDPRRAAAARRAGAGRRGLGLIEMMIALAISASVLTAVAYAVDVSFKTYSVNQEQAALMQRARLVMYRLTQDIRNTKEHFPISPVADKDFKDGRIATDDAIAMYFDAPPGTPAADIPMMVYRHDAANKLLVCVNATGDEFVAARGVEAFQVKFEPMKSDDAVRKGLKFDRLLRATILLTVRTTGQSADIDETYAAQTVTLGTSVMPRRNSW